MLKFSDSKSVNQFCVSSYFSIDFCVNCQYTLLKEIKPFVLRTFDKQEAAPVGSLIMQPRATTGAVTIIGWPIFKAK